MSKMTFAYAILILVFCLGLILIVPFIFLPLFNAGYSLFYNM